MVAYKTHAVVDDNGQVLVQGLPFKPGDRVEIILLEQPQTAAAAAAPARFPLPGPYRFDDPFSPVAADEWDAAKA
jgi:hypothetical protein